ncbi:MAG TPA: aldehyde dehydrogenase family protein [Gemmataceae bacterium]|nr:aldehyde dehydrogenase family protein [Gemmataceae bacterium]
MTPAPVLSRLDHLLTSARIAGRAWSCLPIRRRLLPVRAFRHLLASECEALCAAVMRDLSKPAEETLACEVLPLAEACRFLERQAACLLRPRRVANRLRPLWLWGQRDTAHRRPRGVVGIIGTWNYPLFLNGTQIVQALTAGNAVVWKPSELAPASAAVLRALLLRAGFPAELCPMLEATREAGMALTETGIDHVVFTGSAATGRAIARKLGERLISSTLELSGCDAQLVLDDADVPSAARAAWFGATLNRGQTCLAVRRVFVQRPVYSAFCAALREWALKASPAVLALPAQTQLAERLVREALMDGARLLIDAPAAPGDACMPRVVVDARPEMALCREASFAPVAAVMPFETLDDALHMEALCPYALGASIFTRNEQKALRLAAALRAGMVAINDVIISTAHPATPFGGRGDSGWGVTQGAEGLLEMTIPQVVSVCRSRFRPHYEMAMGQGAEREAEILRGLLQSAHAPSVRERLRGWWRLLRGGRAFLSTPPPSGEGRE